MNNVRHKTKIDSVALQLDFTSGLLQRTTFNQLMDWIYSKKLGYLDLDENKGMIRVHKLTHGHRLLAIFSTGATTIMDVNNRKVLKYYIKIRIAGLQSYCLKADSISWNTLLTISAYFNTRRSNLRIVELDVCIDVFCPFKHVLAICTQKTARTSYYKVGSVYKGSTSYQEYFKDKKTKKQATKVSYLYNKPKKELEVHNRVIEFEITRHEVKFQNNWFLNNEFTADAIVNTLSRYHVMYFENIKTKESITDRYNKYSKVTAREIHQLELENYRVYSDTNVIKEFIRQIQSVYVDFNWNVILPPKTIK